MKDLKVLGSGCAKCTKLFEQTEAAAKEAGIEYSIEKVEDFNKIMEYGVMMTPALVVDGEVKSVGKIPSIDEIKELIG